MTNKTNDDCYFYYYSTCQKAELCPYRHEPTALGCEIVCPDWKVKKCNKPHCSLRHMILKKNRQEIPCYWETQPTGCLKPHCAFRHSLPRHGMLELKDDLMKSHANNNSEMRSYYASNSGPLFPAYSHLSSVPYSNN
ncbi:hypothetical protein PGB90_005129 [Kerria lacca]